MKIQVNKTVSEEVEITLPYFFKTNAHWVAILSEEEGIQICDTSFSKDINLASGNYIYNSMSGVSEREIISANEFYLKYDEIFNNNFLKHLLWNSKR